MFGEKALELIKELKRCGDGLLPPFNVIITYLIYNTLFCIIARPQQEETVRQVLEEMKSLFEENHKDVTASAEGEQGLFPGVQLRHAALERNKRILLTYLNERATSIGELRWQIGTVLPPDIRSRLAEHELTWLQKYNKSLTAYMRAVGVDVTHNLKPPKSLLIEIRCTTEHGSIELTSGRTLHLSRGTHHFLERSECEPLIARGIVEEV